MKNLKTLFLFWAVLIALSASFIGCGKNNGPLGPNDPPPDPVAKDSVVVEITLNVPTGTVIKEVSVGVAASVLPNGFFAVAYFNDLRVHTFVFKTEAKALIGQSCMVSAGMRQASWNGLPAGFTSTNKTIVLAKGMNKVTIDFVRM